MAQNQPFEDDLLHEAEGLDRLVRLFQTFDECLERLIDEYGNDLDPSLILCLELIRYDVNLTLNGVVKYDRFKVPGLVAQLEDVMDEIQTFQAGLKNKKGVKDEN